MTKHYANMPSRLLNDIQNKWVINALRQNCTALVITVAIMHINYTENKSELRFGIVTIERDAKMKKYFFRFYNMENMHLLIQREIKKSLTPYTWLKNFFIQIEINNIHLVFEFIDTKSSIDGMFEFSQVCSALNGDFKRLKYFSLVKYITDNGVENESIFNKFLRRKDKSKHRLPPSDKSPPPIDDGVEAEQIAKSGPTNAASDPAIRNLLLLFGINSEDLCSRKVSNEEVEQFIAKHGGFDKFKQTAVQHGIDLDGGLPESPPEIPTLSSVPKTPPKLVLDRLAAFDPAKQVEIPRNDDICKSPGKRLEEEEEFVTIELNPVKENVRKRFSPDAFVLEINRMRQRINETIRKYKAEKKLKKEQKAKKGQPVSTTPEQTPEKEAPKETEKTLVKEASKTPEKNPSSVSDTTDETESGSDDDFA